MSRLEVRQLRSQLAGPFDLTVSENRLVAITGASGSGKSLFLRLVADLDPGEGEVRLGGILRDRYSAMEWRRKVIYVAAEPGWWKETVAEHFSISQQRPARSLAARLGLAESQFSSAVERLSTGERLRLSLIRAFLLRPEVLLLDEPTGPLDPETTLAVEAYLKDLADQGTTVLIVTHQPEQINRLKAIHYRMVDRKLEPVA